MLLNSITALDAFPNETILIEINDITPSLTNSRVGIHFVDSYYSNYGTDKLKWDNYPLTNAEGSAFFAPTEYMNIAGDFPLLYTVSAYTDHLDLVFLGGTSAISVYPSRPYPSITRLSDNEIAISANYVPLTAFDREVDTNTYRQYASNSDLNPFTSGTISLVGAFKTAIKQNFLAGSIKTATTPKRRFIDRIPLTPKRKRKSGAAFDAVERIIKESMMTQVSFSSPSIDQMQNIPDEIDDNFNALVSETSPTGLPYFLYWDGTQSTHPNAQSNRLYSASIEYPDFDGNIISLDTRIKPGFSPLLSAIASETPSIGDSFIRLYRSGTGAAARFNEDLFLSFHPRLYRANNIILEPKNEPENPVDIFYPLSATSLYFPKNSDIFVWYETSAFTTNLEISNTSITNVFEFSSVRPPYLNGYMFNATTSAGTQRAFTVNYIPSADIVSDDISAISFETKMVDNYYQSTFNINPNDNGLISRFFSDYEDATLSATNRDSGFTYLESQWYPTSAVVWFENNGLAQSYSLTFETSSIYDSRYRQEDVSLILNRDKANLSVNQEDISENSVNLIGSINPDNNNPSLTFEWSVFPPENVILYDVSDPKRIIPTNTPIGPDSLEIRAVNLGVDNTTFTLKSIDFGVEASTTWIPPNNIWANSRLTLVGEVGDFNPINIGSLSAMFIRNGFLYRVPTSANIKWEDVSIVAPNSVEFFTQENEPILELASYPSTNDYSLINARFTTLNSPPTTNNVNYKINCFVFDSLFNYQASRNFSLRRYPSDSNLFTLVSSTESPNIVSSEQFTSIVFPNTASVSLTADILNLDILSGDIIWDVGGSITSGSTVSFDLDTDGDFICVGLSALNVTPIGGGNGNFNFFDNICFYVLTSIQPFEYVAFPQFNYLPTQELNFDNYLSEYVALTSFSACHTEDIFFSATSGFDQYIWRVGNNITTTNTNTSIIPINVSDVAINNTISVSAFNLYFPTDNPGTIYNTANSTGSGFNQHLEFVEFPPITVNIDSSDILVDMRNISSRSVAITVSANVLDLSAGFFNITLSSENFQTSEALFLSQNLNTLDWEFTYGDSEVFQIPENSTNVFNVFLEGTAWGYIQGFDFCAEPFEVVSNMISLTAFDGPDLQIWTPKNVLDINESVIITNTTHNTFINSFTSFDFWNGYELQSGTHSTDFTASYLNIGTYTVSMTGYRSNGDTVTAVWPDFFILDLNSEYDDQITREITGPVVLPYSFEHLRIPANSWQFNTTLNTSFDKLNRNINYLNEQCFIIKDDLPTYDISSFGKYRGKSEWRYMFDINLLNNIGSQYKDLVFAEDYLLILNGNNIEIRSYDSQWTLLNTIDSITDLEIFNNPSRIQVINNKLLILDSGNNNVYVGDIDSNYEFSLTHYWGGVGAKNSRTKLNNAVDMYTSSEFIFIVDKDSSNVKIYNKFLNWINNIILDDASPVAITGYENIVFILDDSGQIRVYEDLIEIDRFTAKVGTRLAYGMAESKLYICTTNGISVYSRNGTYINTLPNIIPNQPIVNVIIFEDEIYNIFNYGIIKNSNFLKYNSITTLTSFSNDDDSYQVGYNEPVTSFVVNDSLDKLKNKLSILTNSLTSQFIKYNDDDDNFLFSSISAGTFELTCSPSQLGLNELVSYETVNREVYNTLQCIHAAADFINGTTIYPTNSAPIWTWEYHKILKNQRPNLDKTPLSWEELISSHPVYSGVSWISIGESTNFENSFPVGWTWEDLEEGCINALTWEEMEDGRLRAYTWEELENVENFGPPFFLFDNCTE